MRVPIWTLLAAVAIAGCEVTDPDLPGNLVPPTVTEDANLPAIELNGSRFHVRTMGDPSKPVIIFLHGGPGVDSRGMMPMGGRFGGYSLADDYFLVFWDQRGAGLSQRHDKTTLTMAQYDADLDAFVNRFSPNQPVFLVGQSWGAMYATQYINLHPARVRGAVLIEAGPLSGARYERIKKDVKTIDLFAEWLNDYAWSSQFISPDSHARMDYEMLIGLKNSQPRYHEATENPEPIWRLGAAVNRYLQEDGQNGDGVFIYDFTTNLAQYTTPVLFIAGALSEVQGASLQNDQMHVFPSASLIVIDGAGHDVQWVKTAQVVTEIRAYLGGR